MKLFFKKNENGVANEEKDREAGREEFDKTDQKLKAKKIGPFAVATTIGAALAFSIYCGPEGEIPVYYPDGGISDGGKDAADGEEAGDGAIEEDGSVDAGDEEAVDGGDQVGQDEDVDGGVEEDGGVDAGDEVDGEVVDGGDEAQDGDAQICEPQTDCDTVQNNPVVLFTINGESIEETKTVDQCVATAEDCSTSVTSESLVFTLSRPLAPEEHQLFMNQHVSSALGVTTQYDTAKRQFGSELAYKEDFKAGETMAGVECLTVNVSNNVTTMFLKYDNKLYQVKSTEPAKQLGDANVYVKVYPGGSATEGVPACVLSDVKLAADGQPIQINGVEYDVSIEVDPQNPNNLAGMRLTRR